MARTEDIFKAAVVLPPAEREDFLARACGSNAGLRREVDDLLRNSDTSAPTAAISAAATQRLRSDQTVGPYRIEAVLGEGGMGVVYRAEDTRLRRKVALKFIKTGFGERFRREAQAVSALNHPNVATLYDVCSHDGAEFLVLEYVDGKPLRGPLPLPMALDYAIQVASALEAAHAAGIIHRDLKPSNIMVTCSGVVKVLDFGLAKHTERAADENSAPSVTREGAIAGTAAYMSPEQAEGKKLDPRSDIFSFGAVLYELISGRRAFNGNTTMSVIAAVLEREPEPLSNIPAELRNVLCRCLRKDAARRWQHIADVRIALEDVKSAAGQAGVERTQPLHRWRSYALAGVAGVALAASGYSMWRYATPSPAAGAFYFEQVTDEPGQELNPALSPDGKSIVYASRAAGNWDIYVLRIGGKNPSNLTRESDADDTQPAFSPDGERIAFRSERDGGGIFVMGSTGESVRRLTDFCYYPAWSPDGTEIACSTANPYRPDVRESSDSQIFVVNVESGETRLVSGGIQDAVQPTWSPDGKRIAFWGVREGSRDIMTVGRDGRDPISVTEDDPLDWNPVWSPDGKYIYFASDRGGAMNLWRAPMNRAGKPSGAPEPVNVPSVYAASVSFSRDGRRLAYSNCQRSSNIYLASFDPSREEVSGTPRALTRGIKETLYPSLSRDGKWVAYTSLGIQEDLVLVHPDGSGQRRITEDAARDRAPRWSPVRDEIAFMSTRTGRFEIWTIRADGSAPTQVTSASPRGGVWYPAWAPDGQHLSYNLPDEMGYVIDAGKPWREQRPRPALAALPPGSWLWLNDWSHDGKKIAGTALKLGSSLGVGAYNLQAKSFEQYTKFGQLPRWLPDGRRVLFHARGAIYLADATAGGRVREVFSVKDGNINPYFDLSWDGRTIAYSLESMDSDVWIMTRRD